MEEKTINKTVRMNEIRKQIAWISSEYLNMFSTDPTDLQMVSENRKFHCSVLLQLLNSLKNEIETQDYDINLFDKIIITKMQTKLAKCEAKNIGNLNMQEKAVFKNSFNLKMD